MKDNHVFCSYLGLLAGDAVDGETSLHIVDQTEVLTGLLDTDHIWGKQAGRSLSIQIKLVQEFNTF